jgi:hypothetical protein
MDMSGRIAPTATGESKYQHKHQNLDSVFHLYIYSLRFLIIFMVDVK